MTNAIYPAITAVMAEMAEKGIGKDGTNKKQGWKFRGIDAVYNVLAPILAKNKIIIFPRCLSRTSTEQLSKSGGKVFCVVVECEFDFICSEDGSKHTVKIFGEAMDPGDKATNKAMSIALKYAAFQTFFIPTDVNADDPDQHTHEVVQEKPWYDLFEQEKEAMLQGIQAGQHTPETIIDQLSARFRLNKDTINKITALGG